MDIFGMIAGACCCLFGCWIGRLIERKALQESQTTHNWGVSEDGKTSWFAESATTTHGRLIDADALLKPIEESWKHAGLHGEDYRKIKKWINNAPTIQTVKHTDEEIGICSKEEIVLDETVEDICVGCPDA